MDIFDSADIEAIRKQIDAGIGLDSKNETQSDSRFVSEVELEAKWIDSEGLFISIPSNLLAEMNWGPATKLEIIMHDNVMILYPMNGFLNLRKIPKKNGRSVLISKDSFGNMEKMAKLAGNCRIWSDDVTCYHRLMIQFSESIPKAFTH